ncbi:hypothetical protein [Dactylosporangium sp. NPDC000521]|uniref:hypothetical protein n=1 Tax=Dactylosporangium sp. NPDC000521 TaxID=3363975 RepID=UPI003690CFC9
MTDPRGANNHAQPPPDEGRRRGRREAPILSYGPIAQHARRLRQARVAAGSPSYKVVGKGAQMSESQACEIASPAKRLPTAQQCAAFLTSVKQNGTPITNWCADHAEYERRAALFRPDLAGVKDRPALRAAAAAALAADGVTDQVLLQRRADAAQHPVPKELPGPVPCDEDLLAEACTDAALLWRVYLGGCSPDDVLHWRSHLDRLPPEPHPAPPPAARKPPVPRRTALLAGAAVLIGAGLAAGGYVLGAGEDGARTGGLPGRGATGTSPPPISPPAGGPAAVELDALIAAAELAQDTTGGTAHVDFVLTTFGPAPTYDGIVSEVTEELDWSPNGPGRRVVTGTGAPANPDPLPPGPPRYAAGPPSTDPAQLQHVLEGLRKPGGVTVLLLGVADLCDTYPLRQAERIAVLRMLRAAPDLQYTGKTTVEKLGLPGKAFSADTADGVRETLVFDQRDGRVLSHETLRRQADRTYLLARRVIYLRSTWDDLRD